ncbi:hypothetical protein [Serratia phage X20]|uniref:Protein spackle n=3 Tax=Winklervirus TaxID=2560256 RepID=A0A1Z1LYU7_9CAUD|nr:spackle periplasmic [Serratia phage X20]ARW58003.1 hypothetical protein [Serratia phage X20]UJJ22013.1 spackle periplasmic protein [Erwinia phage Virsaitis27]
MFLTNEDIKMKRIVVALALTISSCAPAYANLDKDMCEWSMTEDQTQVEAQIRADVRKNVEIHNPGSLKAVMSAISKPGQAINLNYNMYCDETFDNAELAKWILG